MGFGAAVAYTIYILIGDRVGAGVPPLALAALVCTGRDVHVRGRRGRARRARARLRRRGLGWIGAIALVSTVGAILAFFAGLARVGPSAASILSTLEPVVTVGARGGGVRRVAPPVQLPAARSCSARSW